jgi:hypothetical protein
MTCFNCLMPVSSVRDYMFHLQQCVDSDPEKTYYICNNGNCVRKYSIKSSFRKHLISHLVNSASHELNDYDQNVNDPEVPSSSDIPDPVPPELGAALDDLSPQKFKREILLFMMSLYGDVNMSRTRAQEIINTYRKMLVTLLRSLKNNINDLDDKVRTFIDEMMFFFEKSGIISSEYRFFQELERLGLVIRPEQMTIHIENTEKHNVQMIPLANIFYSLFRTDGFMTSILNYIKSFSEQKIVNIMQTQFWRDKIKDLDQSSTLYLPLLIFFDDLEVLNAMGSHSGIYKLGATYIQLGCLPKSLQSKVKMIFLGLLFFSEDRKMIGNERMFQMLIEQLNKLYEEGIDVDFGTYKQIKFVPVLIIGDNLGIHQILGFVEGFNATHLCRFCNLSLQQIKDGICPEESDLRSVENYEIQLSIDNTRMTGLTERCVFNKLKSYHVISSPSVDIMHDLQEGVCHYIVCRILLQFINEDKYFSLDLLNQLILIFEYGPIQLNKPNLITMHMITKNKLKNSAAEMMTFCTYLPFIIGHLVDQNSPYWDLFISLRFFMRIVFQKTCSPGTHELLHFLAKELIEKYVACFGSTVPPKLHFLYHYKMVMKNIGPLTNISCDRFESKHQEFTKISKHLHCRKNFTYSLALKHQLVFANYLFSQDFNSSDEILCGHMKTGIIPEISAENEVNICSNIEYNGMILKRNVVIQIGFDEYLMPLFGMIVHIIEDNDKKIKIYFKILINKGFDEHYFSYEIEDTDVFVLLFFEDLDIERISTVCKNANGTKMITWG